MDAYVVPAKMKHRPVEVEIKRSRFIGFVARVEDEEDARQFLSNIRNEHPQARHVCHAFVIGADRRTQRFSDDGEPSGTAGTPILEAITHRQTSEGKTELSDVAVAVVRYFGGIKLGAGGLVQAYSDSTARALDSAKLVKRAKLGIVSLTVPYEDAGRLETDLRNNFTLRQTQYGASGAILTICYPSGTYEKLQTKIAELSAGKAMLEKQGFEWVDYEK
ncbi:YigZ family protein [Propionimicrobium lymphophilum]|uniref:YigZ family protein n=1 Tax=Propionimicrobium lymphophilum TaxID=33012 RepID=UPI0023F1244E|nr:YigZ family protein [Propionimicrobium lymphophilum]